MKIESLEPTVNNVMASIIRNKNYPASKEPISDETDEDDLMLCKAYCAMLQLSRG